MANYQSGGPESDSITRISAGSVLKGDIASPNDIRIDGSFEGRICSQAKVSIGRQATVSGDIICESAEVWGRVDGNLYVKDTLALKETCVLNGDLHIKRLQVDLEASFNGTCRMISEDEFNRLTDGEQPGMYDVQQETSPFTISDEIPEA